MSLFCSSYVYLRPFVFLVRFTDKPKSTKGKKRKAGEDDAEEKAEEKTGEEDAEPAAKKVGFTVRVGLWAAGSTTTFRQRLSPHPRLHPPNQHPRLV